jgi:ubiquinone biosynthesis protein UbiJ
MDRFSPLVFRPIESLINHSIANSPEAQLSAAALDGQSLDVRIDGTPIALRLVIVGGIVQLSQPDASEDDSAPFTPATASLSGPPISMLRLLTGDPQALIRAGDIRITGSTDAADRFRELLYHAKPDIEAGLAAIVGQSAAHQLGSFARGISDFSMRAGEKLAQRMSEHLTTEKRSLLTQAELDGFLKAVDTLANDVERAAARVEALRKRQA